MQRFVLEELQRYRAGERDEPYRWLPAHELAARRAGGRPTTAEIKTMQRVIRKLATKGAIDAQVQAAGTFGFRYLHARLPVGADEQALDDEQEADSLG